MRFMKDGYSASRLKVYFPVFSTVVLSLLFSLCVLHYSKQPFFFSTETVIAE